MGNPRPCGCKGVRTCLLCETEYGVAKRNYLLNEKNASYVYCVLCKKAWKGWDADVWAEHPNHTGDPIHFPGIYIELDFLTLEEQTRLIHDLDGVPWDLSQSGRRKQNYGPKCNFKRRKMKPGDFSGFPKFSEFVQQRFLDVSLLEGFRTVEQCSLEYVSERGASIDPHIDDCWVWGERVVTVNVVGDSVLTLNHYPGLHGKYNLADVKTYPRVISEEDQVIWNPFRTSRDSEAQENGQVVPVVEQSGEKKEDFSECHDSEVQSTDHHSDGRKCFQSQGSGINIIASRENCLMDSRPSTGDSYTFRVDNKDAGLPIVRVPMPARSLLVMYGTARYEWEHSVLREDITDRRVCLAYREFTPPFLKGGSKEYVGLEVLQRAAKFW